MQTTVITTPKHWPQKESFLQIFQKSGHRRKLPSISWGWQICADHFF